MRLTHCTITGADDKTKVSDLVEIGKGFPSVEWGILYGKEQNIPRFPNLDWIHEFVNSGLRGAVHLCGIQVREYLGDNLSAFCSQFRRVQLNLFDYRQDTQTKIVRAGIRTEMEIIVPLKPKAGDIWRIAKDLRRFSFLFDSSGGKGISPKSWPRPIAGVRCGYAGGIGPENIKDVLASLEEIVGDGFTWIDMESNVRTKEVLDLDKVHKCLEAAQPYANWV